MLIFGCLALRPSYGHGSLDLDPGPWSITVTFLLKIVFS